MFRGLNRNISISHIMAMEWITAIDKRYANCLFMFLVSPLFLLQLLFPDCTDSRQSVRTVKGKFCWKLSPYILTGHRTQIKRELKKGLAISPEIVWIFLNATLGHHCHLAGLKRHINLPSKINRKIYLWSGARDRMEMRNKIRVFMETWKFFFMS